MLRRPNVRGQTPPQKFGRLLAGRLSLDRQLSVCGDSIWSELSLCHVCVNREIASMSYEAVANDGRGSERVSRLFHFFAKVRKNGGCIS